MCATNCRWSLVSKLDFLSSLNKIDDQTPEETLETEISEAPDRKKEIRTKIYRIKKLSLAK